MLVGSQTYINDSKPTFELISSIGFSCLDLGTGECIGPHDPGLQFCWVGETSKGQGFDLRVLVRKGFWC